MKSEGHSPRQQVPPKITFPILKYNNKFIGIKETASSTYNVQPSDMAGEEERLESFESGGREVW